MSTNLSKLLKKVFIGSMAGISTTSAGHAEESEVIFNYSKDTHDIESNVNKKIDFTPKLILKINNNRLSFMSHRSHRSHSSHRSHYSSSSGSSGTPSSKQNSGIKPNFLEKPKAISPVLQLGSRTLKLGMKGTDVTELINILLQKKYLVLEDGGTNVTGIYEYDQTIEDTIKRFQEDNGITVDGICAATTIYYLKNK
tara:strand:+ start:10903 stop:11493 length:591 start_codon:yes stop_codon:yes gene_type:complete